MRVLLGLVALAGCDAVFGLGDVDKPADAMIDAPIQTGWKATAASYGHTCGIRADDTLWCWGDNEYGTAGTGSPESIVAAPTRIGTTTFSSVSAGYAHACGIATDATLWCWGYNLHGELGVGSHMPVRVPVAVGGTWKQVSAGGYTTCAIRDDDTLWCWGYNYWGEAGTGASQPLATPMQVGLSTWSDVDVGWYQTCGVQADGSLWCWGSNAAGALGNASLSQVAEPSQVIGEQWKDVDVGGHVACGITTSGKLRCWGDPSRGAVPIAEPGPVVYSPQPVLALGVEVDDWVQVSIDFKHGCATRSDGSLWCWGDNSHGQLARPDLYLAEPQPLTTSPSVWRRVDTGYWHTCAIDGDNQLWCVGSQYAGQLGNGIHAPNAPAVMPGAAPLLAAGPTTTCSTDESGQMLCAGLYKGEARPVRAPVDVSATTWRILAPGTRHTCGVTATDSYCWGDNTYGALGGTPDDGKVRLGGAYPQLEATDHTCGIWTNGYVYCWGYNGYGQVGNGTQVSTSTQTYVGANATDLAIGSLHTCVTVTTGGAYCWGRGYEGQLGNNTQAVALTASLVSQPPNVAFASIAAGGLHTCALSSAGRLYCWGNNSYGQLGAGDLTPRYTPHAIGTATWTQIALGYYFTCGIQNDGSLWCWGHNTYGQLGTGTYFDRYAPVRVGTATDWTSITAGNNHACGKRATGEYYCWGTSSWGQVPDGKAFSATLVLVP